MCWSSRAIASLRQSTSARNRSKYEDGSLYFVKLTSPRRLPLLLKSTRKYIQKYIQYIIY